MREGDGPSPAPPSWRRRVVKTAAAAVDRVRRPPRGVVVLIYHRVGRRSSMSVDLPLGLFEAQVAELAASGRVVTLERGLALLAGAPDGGGGPRDEPDGPAVGDAVVVTFDDGTTDLAELATPVLARHGVPATLYLATRFVDRGDLFPDDGRPLSWAGVRELHDSGVWSIESHTHTHSLLDRLADAAVDGELDRSIELIGEHTGRAPRHFAYPKALAGTAAADRAVRARFASAALAGTRPNPVGATDPWRLARTPLQADDGMRWFRAKLDGGLRAEDDLRRLANRVRYLGRHS